MSISIQHSEKKRVSGVILIDKPHGITSQQVVAKVKYLFKSPKHDSKKAGHTGTLDPMATGLLPVCLGEATKFSHYQLEANKSYIATLKLGVQTDTGDAQGDIIATADIPSITADQLLLIVNQFLGNQCQIPPMYSALKKEGKKLYEYARSGIEVKRDARPITIYALDIKQLEPDVLNLTVTCSKGTYIRVLGEDIAKACNTLGHLTRLRRISVGHFSIDETITLEELESLELSKRFEYLLAVDACIDDIPQLILEESLYLRLRLGQRINIASRMSASLCAYLLQGSAFDCTDSLGLKDRETVKKDIRIMNGENQFVGLATLQLTGRLQPKKMIHL